MRKDGRFEIKLQVAGGMLTAEQVKRAGEVAARYGSEVHLTVRQELSILGVAEDNLEKALNEFARL